MKKTFLILSVLALSINSYGQNWADSIFYSSIRPNEELKLHTHYTDTLEYLGYDDDYDDFFIFVKKDDKTVGTLICNDIHQTVSDLSLNRGDIAKIRWTIDSLRPEGDKELLWFKEYVIKITKIKDGKKEIALRDSFFINFILEYCQYKDGNPIWQPDADSINVLIHDILYAKNEAEKQKLKTKTLELLYENSVGLFEDAVDADRMGSRRALCFIALALFEDEYRYEVFLNDARACLSEISPTRNYDRGYALIDIIETFIMMRLGHSQKQIDTAIEKLRKNIPVLEKQGQYLSEFTEDYINLLNFIIENKTDNFTK